MLASAGKPSLYTSATRCGRRGPVYTHCEQGRVHWVRSGSSDCVWPGAQAEGKSQAERFLGLGFWVLLPRESDKSRNLCSSVCLLESCSSHSVPVRRQQGEGRRCSVVGTSPVLSCRSLPPTGDTFTGSPWLLHRLLPTACLVFLCYAKDIYSELHFFSQLLTTSHRPAPQNRLRTLFWWESPVPVITGIHPPAVSRIFLTR